MIRPALRVLSLSVLGLIFGTANATADLLVDPAGGTTITFNPYGGYPANDEGVASRSLGGTFNFFGTALNSITVTVNGSLNTLGISEYQNQPLANLPSTINPFYDDLNTIYGSVSDKVVNGSYYAVTWNKVNYVNDTDSTHNDTFQAILFTGNTVLDGFQFRAGDIAFSYGAVLQNFYSRPATVGLSNSDGSITTPLPGTTDGRISDTSLLPTGSQFALFRGNTNGTYNASIQATSVPEPSSWVLLGAGVLIAAWLRPRGVGLAI